MSVRLIRRVDRIKQPHRALTGRMQLENPTPGDARGYCMMPLWGMKNRN